VKKILCIGGSGFIGGAYSREIVKRGFQVINYDLPEYSILDVQKLFNLIRQVDIVIHFAAMADVTVCIKELNATFETNIHGTYNVAKLCAQEYKPLIFISTCCVYGNSLDELETENSLPMAAEPYAVSKVAGEYILRGMPHLKYAMLRIGTVYGPGMREALFTYIALDAVKNGKTIRIDGDGAQSRQLIYIDDLIDGICRTTQKIDELPNGIILNLCGTEKTSAIETMETAEKVVGKFAVFVHREQRYGQTFHENISVERAERYLGWRPTTKFYDGMLYTFKSDPRFK
jgi:nucleoside-diphosphate-sugar epimerase